MRPASIFAKNTNSLRCDNPIGEPFFELSEVDSSNNYAMGQVQAQMAAHGTTWFAWHQKAGKGQRGKTWSAEPGQNIVMSCVVEPQLLSIENQFMLSASVALACFDFFSRYALNETKIKWPNDIYWRDRKAGGILIENSYQGKQWKYAIVGTGWKYAIVGTGLNINQTLFPDAIVNAVSLKQITGKTLNVIDLAKELCCCLTKRLQALKTSTTNEVLAEYQSHLYKLYDTVSFKKDNAVFKAKVTGITNQGYLLINTGIETEVPFGSVEWIIA